MASASPSSESNKPPSVSSNEENDVLSENFWDKPEFVVSKVLFTILLLTYVLLF